MNYKLPLAAGLIMALSFASVFAQAPTDEDSQGPTSETSTSPVAFVYIASGSTDSIDGGPLQTYGFAAAANGKLTKIPGSPFAAADVQYMGVNGKYLFGTMTGDDGSTVGIETFSIASNGALKSAQTFKYKESSSDFTFPWSLGLDHFDQVVYVDLGLSDPDAEVFQALGIDQSNGKLHSIAQTSIDPDSPTAWLSFLADNKFAYSADTSLSACAEHRGLVGFTRASNGKLTTLNIGNPIPPAPEANHYYCVQALSTDPSNHIAAALYDEDASGKQYGNPVMATFTVSSTGELTTTSTSKNMPQVIVGANEGPPNVSWIRMSPSGELLAVASYEGIEIFHFNGSSPMTKFKSVNFGQGPYGVTQVYWDNANHLYVYDGDFRLAVFNVTSTSVTPAPGSPYSVPFGTSQDETSPGGLIVLPR